MSLYRAKPCVDEAVQWSGSNWHQMLAWITSVPDCGTFVSGEALIVQQGGHEVHLDPTDWLILWRDKFWMLEDDDFKAAYEPVEDL